MNNLLQKKKKKNQNQTKTKNKNKTKTKPRPKPKLKPNVKENSMTKKQRVRHQICGSEFIEQLALSNLCSD
jgi:hypothetical protein